ncbi:MAG: TIGR00730 family Rossman fold protein [Bryobacteraceae bacterium]
MSDSTKPPRRRPLAYKNEQFLATSDARPLRILSEYLEPLAHFRKNGIRDTVVFFGSARVPEQGRMSEYYQAARDLAREFTAWSERMVEENGNRRFVVCSGGGPGIMEAANRGASEAGGMNAGFNISLPFEQLPNPYISPELNFEFHYFFMRKFWFAYLAKALVAFPGGFGTLDEVMEILTLAQTQKLAKKLVIILYGTEFWSRVLNFEALVETGMISAEDLSLFQFADDTETAMKILTEGLLKYHVKPEPELPAIARTRVQEPGRLK